MWGVGVSRPAPGRVVVGTQRRLACPWGGERNQGHWTVPISPE